MISSSQLLNSYIRNNDFIAKSYLSFLIVHGGAKQRQPTRPKQLLSLMGDITRASVETGTHSFIAAPLDVNTPLPFLQNIPDGFPKEKMIEFAEYMCKTPNLNIM